MVKETTKLEVIAPSIEEAIENGLRELGLTENDVDIEILDEGKKGLLGLGSRHARIALRIKSDESNLEIEEDEVLTLESPNMAEKTLSTASEEIEITHQVVDTILEKMHVRATVTVRLGVEDDRRVQPILVDIEGNDLSFLIGRKAETINALQFITGLIVSREVGRWIPIQIDVQQYRKRREDELRKLARRIADQVVSTHRSQALESMPPNERRIIHLELSENPQVGTESEGEEPTRKVVVYYKN